MKGLVIDQKYYDRNFSESTVPWSGEFWKERLKNIVSFKDNSSVDRFIQSESKRSLY
jgi:choline/glycine/proline betaine transport protein